MSVYDAQHEVALALADRVAALETGLAHIFSVARYGEEGRDDYENLNTIIGTAGRLLGKPEAECHR